MTLQEVYEGIGLQPQLVELLEHMSVDFDWQTYTPYIRGMQQTDTAWQSYCALRALLLEEGDLGNYKALLCQLEAARQTESFYWMMEIPREIYWDTMKCFTRFCGECLEKTGSLHFDRGWWTWRQLSLQLFRIGALEYELRDRDGQKTVALHIPSDADLRPEAVEESLRRARKFMWDFFPDYCRVPFTCRSWLLSPTLTQFLDEDSNILAFQKRFTVTQTEDGEEYIEWLFRRPFDTPAEELPESTRLQRRVKAWLLETDESIGAGYGVLHTPAVQQILSVRPGSGETQ